MIKIGSRVKIIKDYSFPINNGKEGTVVEIQGSRYLIQLDGINCRCVWENISMSDTIEEIKGGPMNKQEALKKIEELKKFIEHADKEEVIQERDMNNIGITILRKGHEENPMGYDIVRLTGRTYGVEGSLFIGTSKDKVIEALNKI